jgi:hypothetical protein
MTMVYWPNDHDQTMVYWPNDHGSSSIILLEPATLASQVKCKPLLNFIICHQDRSHQHI